MLFIRLLKLIFGYVTFRADSGFTERFINLCSLNRIPLWDLNRADGITASTTVEAYKRIRPCLRKSGMKARITERHGLPFFIKKYSNRAGLAAGAIFFFCFIYAFSNMIWTIDISGNNKTSEQEILSVLAEQGLKAGVLKDKIDAAEIRFYALAELPEVTYLTVNVMGCSVKIDVTEKIEKPQLISAAHPCDVVSAVDGQIEVLEVYEGTKLHRPGEAVTAGECLAGGFIELKDGSVKFRHAEAYAIIKTEIPISVQTEAEAETLLPCAERMDYTLNFFGVELPLFLKTDEEAELSREFSVKIASTRLPIGFKAEHYVEYEKNQRKPTKNELTLTTAENYAIKKAEQLKDTLVLNSTVAVTPQGISGSFFAEKSAGISQALLLVDS